MKQMITLQNEEKKVLSGLRKAKELYEELSLDSDTQRLYLNKPKDIKVPLFPDDYIIIRGGEKITIGSPDSEEESNPTVNLPIRIEFNGKKIEEGLKKAKISGKDICLLDKELENTLLFAHLDETTDVFIQNDFTLVIQDNDSYFTVPFDQDNIIDLEECTKKDRHPPKGQKFYKIKIDGKKYKVEGEEITGEAILKLVNKTYNEWSLNQKFYGGRRKPIEPKELVDLTQKGIERFETIRKQAQQGLEVDQFPLPPDDTEYLKVNLSRWKPLVEGSKKGIIISNYELPDGYAPKKADLMIMIPENYPTANLDMFYFSPGIRREDNMTIEGLSDETHFGKQWQKWSRHYEWRAGVDNMATHIPYIRNQLEFELNKG